VKIGWNKIQGYAGIKIAEAIKVNTKITIFDGAFNSFGNKKNGEFGLKIGEAANLGHLRHLDISYNSLDANECKIFAETI